ncbi:MAG TPA: peptidylprolyl isomerase [Armatimonadota bacterium]|jgi:parvulin-like peptidyl-prolyl isomerase
MFSLTGLRTNLHKHAITAILIIGGLAILLPVFFSGAGGGRGRRNPEEDKRQQAVAERDKPVAKVGAITITRGELDDDIDRQVQSAGQPISPLQKHQYALQVLDGLETQAMLVNAAEKQGIKVSSDEVSKELDKQVAAQAQQSGVNDMTNEQDKQRFMDSLRNEADARRDQVRQNLITQKLVDKLRKNVSITTPGIKPEDIEVNARHILISWKGLKSADPSVKRTKAEAKALADQLAAQAKANPSGFAALADKNTEDKSGKGKGGSLDWFAKNAMVKPFADAAFAAQPGQVVGPVETQFGYHVIKVEDRRVSIARSNQEVQKFIDDQKKAVKPVLVATDLKALQAFHDYTGETFKKDKSQAEAKRKAAIAAYEVAVKERPTDPALYAMLGELHRQKGETAEALAAYQKAASLPPPSADIQLALGDTYRAIKQKDKALDAYKIAARLAGPDMNSHFRLQMAFKDMGEEKLARQQGDFIKAQSAPAQRPMAGG